MEVLCRSLAETSALAHRFGKELPLGSILCLFGDLGAGKTTFVKGLVESAAGVSSESVNSPTFVYLNIYEGEKTVYHFDLYRLEGADQFLGMGFDEYFYAGGICCVEWSEKIESVIPSHAIRMQIITVGESERLFRWNKASEKKCG